MGGIGVAALLKLLSIGAVLGLIPIIWVGYRGRGDAYRRLIWVTAFLTLDLIMFGGFTRLTDSGLGCPDWPGCYEQATPFHARDHIAAAQTADPYGPVTLDRAWIEMLHRYFAMAVGLLITAITVLAWWGRHRSDRPSPWYASFLLVLVCIQGAFGAWTVILKLQPVIVTLHLLFGMALLGGLTWLASLHRLPVALSLGRGAVDVPAALLLKGARPWYSRIRQYGLQR
ncbi:MAG: COX15/CtaA family protein, partial [Ottowia sp.]|nr:COX15/CtaA family protein [Ottowia sp.]